MSFVTSLAIVTEGVTTFTKLVNTNLSEIKNNG